MKDESGRKIACGFAAFRLPPSAFPLIHSVLWNRRTASQSVTTPITASTSICGQRMSSPTPLGICRARSPGSSAAG